MRQLIVLLLGCALCATGCALKDDAAEVAEDAKFLIKDVQSRLDAAADTSGIQAAVKQVGSYIDLNVMKADS